MAKKPANAGKPWTSADIKELSELASHHPAVHGLSRSLRRERELCTDALAVRLIGDPLALVEALQSIARLRLESPRIPAVGASLGGPSASIVPRIQELIGMTPSRPRFSVWPLAALPAAGLLALFAAAAGVADDRPASAGAPPRVANADGPPIPSPGSPLGPPPTDPTHGLFGVDVGPIVADDDRQIAYEVRYVVGPAQSWRSSVLDRMTLIKQDADVAAWTLDDRALLDRLTQAQRDTRTNVISAPKITHFNGARATVINRKRVFYVAGVDMGADVKAGVRPIVKNVDEGHTIDMTGVLQTGATRLAVSVSDSRLAAMRTMFHELHHGGEVQRAQYQVPTVVERNCRVACEIPRGRHLAISLGLHDEPREVRGLAAVANDVITSVGLPRMEPAPDTFERLVIITPVPIILEPEQRTGSPPRPRVKLNG